MPLISESAMSAIKTRFGYNKSKQIEPVESSAVKLLKSSSSVDLMQKSASKFLLQSSSKAKSDDGETAPYDVPRTFEFSEDPSFWKDHNVQVIIRVRPLNSSELSTQGQNRCVKQDSSQSVTWLGHPESRFTFDIVADESVSQEMLFKVAGVRLVENCMEGYNSCMFAYGQTGSGKTHTMLGDIEGGARRHSVNCGMTPRVFEYLFSRIQKDKDARREEKLKFTCKCSFLEIYNEQILDLLDPSSANLQIREDTKKGVYVENLTEVEVTSARDVIQQLIQGAANRKVAATNMNHASSRSHSVFTCIIESKWESQGVTHYRFARLNLVDLAGSERQKSSGAEGERLKEATNINKSLSTLGLVIMNLVSISNGKSLHVPYRDSKLTFLLQDSLGGNAKTIMIANISPSTSCSLETLSTLKFAQRAKFIKNHAIVNEDASGDVLALRLENQHLKKEVSRLRSLVNEGVDSQGADALSLSFSGSPGPFKWDGNLGFSSPLMAEKKLSHLQKKEYEVALVGAFRREKDKDMALQALTEEHQKAMHLNKQREDENQGLKMRLRFREAGIKRLEAVASGKISAETHLLKEKEEHLKEIEVLRAQVDRNQDATRFAMENLRLSEEIRRLKSFCEEGERERMDEQLMIMENKLLEALDWKLMNESGPADTQNDLQSDTDFLSSNQESSSPWRTTMNEENEFLRMQAIQNQSELDSLRKNLEFCVEEKEKLARNIDDLAKKLEVERSREQSEGPCVMNSHIPRSDQMEIKTMVDAIAAASQREAEAHEMAIFLSKENDGLNMKLKVLIEDNNKLIDLYERAAAENNNKGSSNSLNLQDVSSEKELEMQQKCDSLKRQLTEMHEENERLLGLYEKAMQETTVAENNKKNSGNSLNLQDDSSEDHSTDLIKVAEEKELEMQQECDSLKRQLTEMHEENDKLLGLYEKAMQERAAAENNNKNNGNSVNLQDDSSEDHSTNLSIVAEEKELEMQQECDSLKRQLTEMHEENDKLLGLYEKAMQERATAEHNNMSRDNPVNLQDDSTEDHSTILSKVAEEKALEMQQVCDSLKRQLTEMHEENNKLLGLYENAMRERAVGEINNKNIGDSLSLQDGSSENHTTNLSNVDEEKKVEIQQECDSLKRQLTEMHDENEKLLGLYEKAMQERDEFKRVVASGQQNTPYEKTEFTCPDKLVEVNGGQCLQFDDEQFSEVESVIQNTQNDHDALDFENFPKKAQLCDVHVQVDSKGLSSVRKMLIEAQEKLSHSTQTVNMFFSLERALIDIDELSEKLEKVECNFQQKQKEISSLKLHSTNLWERNNLSKKKLSALKNSMNSFSSSLEYFENNEAVARFNVNALSQNLARRKEKVSSLQVSRYETTNTLSKLQQTKIDVKNVLRDLTSKFDEENREVENGRIFLPIENVLKSEASELLKTEEEKLKLQSQIKSNTKKLADVRKETEVVNRKLVKIESEMKVLETEVQKDVISLEDMERKLRSIVHQKEMLLEVNENGMEEFKKMVFEYYESFFEAELKEVEVKFVDEEMVVELREIVDLRRVKNEAVMRKRDLVESMGCDLSFVTDKVEEDFRDIAMSVKELNHLIESCSLADC